MDLKIKIIISIILAIVSGILYRWGGQGKPFNTKVRDMGCPTIWVINMLMWVGFHWTLIISFGAFFGALTTYWDFVNKWFHVEQPDSEYWWNWLMHSVGVSLATLPFVIAKGLWIGFILDLVLAGVCVTVWSQKVGKDTWEERGRGFFLNLFKPLVSICR